jgi:hypothetical protein
MDWMHVAHLRLRKEEPGTKSSGLGGTANHTTPPALALTAIIRLQVPSPSSTSSATLLIVPSFTFSYNSNNNNNNNNNLDITVLGVGILIAAARQPNFPLQCQTISRRHYLAAPTDRRQSTHITQTNPTKILLYYHDLTIPLDMMAQKMTRASEYPPLQRLHYDHYKASAEAQ